ncbi:hypothetical protein UPYG_G00059100 [Umbra pygmaea]|uniref:Uncharacterized protein n=1 Tax=Umbra pygmaea TaxID=75934 RepID=A0ABD0XQV5_UMBPY
MKRVHLKIETFRLAKWEPPETQTAKEQQASANAVKRANAHVYQCNEKNPSHLLKSIHLGITVK